MRSILLPENRNMTNAELEENLPSLKIRSVDQHSAGNYAATFRQAHADEIRETAARLASAQVAVYPVDARLVYFDFHRLPGNNERNGTRDGRTRLCQSERNQVWRGARV